MDIPPALLAIVGPALAAAAALGGAYVKGRFDLAAAKIASEKRETQVLPAFGRTTLSSLPSISLKPCVLVVDDEPSYGRSLARLIESYGFEAHAVTTCEEAQALARLHPYAAHLLDLILPDCNGLDLAAKLRPLTIIHSGAGTDELDALRASHVVDHVVEKDGRFEALGAILAKLAESYRLPPRDAASNAPAIRARNDTG